MTPNKDHRNIVHATFSATSLNTISSEISNKNLTGSCILIGGNWHFGPLKKRNIGTISAWFLENLGYIPENLSTDTQTIDKDVKIFAWVDFLSSEEYVNFIHWATSPGMQEFSLISLPENTINPAADPHNFTNLLNDAIEKDMSDIKIYTQEWDALVDENSDFRLIDSTGKIRSLSSSHFDKYIIDSVTREWESSPMVVLRIMEKLDSEKQTFPGDIFLYHRLEKFFLSGAIEKQADISISQTLIRTTNP
ncbi:DUF3658 domain-containing protein [Burkholderia sp. 22313]|uniref:DUF3658 domain-containing protein n=1 Tax=Burkholderia sp. 22313 TaxID=3453908 RepID=UPI003F84363E